HSLHAFAFTQHPRTVRFECLPGAPVAVFVGIADAGDSYVICGFHSDLNLTGWCQGGDRHIRQDRIGAVTWAIIAATATATAAVAWHGLLREVDGAVHRV